MHSFLLVGYNLSSIENKIADLVTKLNLEKLVLPIAKIEDVRNLEKFIKLSFARKTAILIRNIDQATEEALNALLKHLEEPNPNLYFILTAKNTQSLVPTVVSRCQIIEVKSITKIKSALNLKKFLDSSVGQQFNFLAKIKDRKQAIEFLENLIKEAHFILVNNGEILSKKFSYSKLFHLLNQTLKNLHSNGNINLQLTNLVVSLHYSLSKKAK